LKWTILLFVSLFEIASVAAAPMTHDQVVAMVKDKGIDWAADWIASAYTAVPAVTMPSFTALATGVDLAVSTDGPIGVSISDKLAYKLAVGPWVFRGVVPHIDPWRLVEAGGIGLAVGVVGTLLVTALTGHLH
jgi:hypothetical protein